MIKLSLEKFSIIFRTLLIIVLCLIFGGSITFANSYENSIQHLLSDDCSTSVLLADATETLPQLNQSTEIIRDFTFNDSENVTLEENMGTTSSGIFSVNGVSSEENSIVFNKFSGFVVSKIQTTLNINNVTISGAESAIGSAIYNTASDAEININNVSFESNSTLSQTDALGGAIYSNGKLTLTNTSFIGNSATTTGDSAGAKGGAIYARNSIQMIADSDNVVIVDNFTQTSDGTKENNAIYIDNSSATLNISAINSGTFAISDSINGATGYKVSMTGDGTGRIGLFDSIYNANISVSNVDISFADGKVTDHQLDNLNIGNNVNFIINADLANGIADTIISPNSTGTISISEISIISGSTDSSVKLQVIKNSNNLTLNIDKVSSKLATTLQSTMYNDSILADSITLGTTDRENDSIIISGWKDVLYEMVHDTNPTHMLKNFIFNTPTEYVLTKDLGEMPQESILSIYNLSGAKYGVINANEHSMFELVNPITSVNLKNILIKNAKTDKNGSVAYLGNTTSSFNATNSMITSNKAEGDGGAIYAKSGTLSLRNSTVSENTSSGNGGALYVTDDAQVELVNVDFKSNTANGNGGAIYANKDVTVSAENGSSTFDGNKANGESNAIYATSDATVTLNARNNGTINMNDKISGEQGYKLNITGNSKGNVNLNNNVSNANVTLSGTNLNLAKDNLLKGNEFNARGGNLNLINGEIGNTDFSKLTTGGTTKVGVDVDLANKSMDRVTADSYGKMNGTLNVNKMNLLSDSKESTVKIKFADSPLKDHVKTSLKTVTYSRVYKYLVSYSKSDGYFSFTRGGGTDASSFNPAILPLGIAQQTAYMNELQNYQSAMYHSDTYMMLPKKVRMAGNNDSRYAVDFDDIEGETFIEKYLAIPEEIKSIWVRPYASFEHIPLKNGPTVSSMNYGTVFGGDSNMIELSHGFKAVYGGYVGYNGNTTSYSNVNSLQQGAVIGVTGNLYKGNFFNTLTANVGWMINDSDTEYGSDTMHIIMSGFADKMGYNIEVNSGKVIIQPSLMMGYTFVYASDYTTSSGINIESDPLHVVHFAPGLKVIANLANGWQPYATFTIMCNFIDKTNFTASTIRLPQMSIDPYVEYGIGIQKRWQDKYSGFAQATVRNGGRRGVALLFGFRYMFGKIISREHFIVRENLGKKKTLFKERKEPEIEIGSLTPSDKNKTKPSTPVAEQNGKSKFRFSVIDGLKKVSRIIFFKYNTDVSAKVVTDVYPDGVIMTTLKGMDTTGKNKNNMSSEFKDKDLVGRPRSTESNMQNRSVEDLVKPQQPKQNIKKQQTKLVEKQVVKPQVQQTKPVEKQVVKPQAQQTKPVEKQVVKPQAQQTKPVEKQVVKQQAKQTKPVEKQVVKSQAQQTKPVEKQVVKSQAQQTKPVEKQVVKPQVQQTKPVEKQVVKSQAQQTKPVEKQVVKPQAQQTKPVEKQVVKPQVQQTKLVEKQVVKPQVQQTKPVEKQVVKPQVQQVTTSIPATVIKAPKRNIEIMPINVVNKKNLYLNQNNCSKPEKVQSYDDYSVEVIKFNF